MFPMQRRILAIALLTAPLFAQPSPTRKDEMVAMRDGVKLATTIYSPPGEGPFPVILTRTPYGKDNMYGPQAHKQFIEAGYVRVVQDVRGKFKSEGKYAAFVDDIVDGYDTVEWIAKQPWSNGKVGMYGPSAMGITQNLAAISNPPHLVTCFVQVAPSSSFRYSSYPGGLFLQDLNEGWLKAQGVPPADVPRPIIKTYDEDARARDLRAQAAHINIPMYNVGGWYDIFLQGSIDSFKALQEDGGPKARGNQKLMMGAFGHGAMKGDLKYPAEAGNLNGGDPIKWFDHWMKGVDNGIMKEPAVRYYVMGDTMDKSAPGNQWRTAATWPPQFTATSYYLTATHGLALTKPGKGTLSYIYDPKSPTPAVGGNNLIMDRGPMDQRKVTDRDDVVKFTSEPLKAPLEITGPMSAELAVSTNVEDTDFIVKLIDVYPNGYEALVIDEGTRLRFAIDPKGATHAQKNKVYNVKVDLWSTSLVFNTGHKIEVVVQSSNAPRFEPHSNTWEPVKSYDQSLKATNTIVLDGKSRLILPVAKAAPASSATGGGR